MTDRIVIVGGGQAAGQLLMQLRRGGFDGELVCVTDEARAPYQRPPLSKLYLAGKLDAGRLAFPPPRVFKDLGVTLRSGVRAVGLDTDLQSLGIDDGTTLEYAKLAIATGARPIHLDVPGRELGGIHYLRRIEDADAIRDSAAEVDSVVIVGAGYIGLEVAATLRAGGLAVTVLEQAAQILPRVASAPVARFMSELHASNGVEIRTGTRVTGFEGRAGQVTGVTTADGAGVPADLVIVGVGIRPDQQLAFGAGLDCDDGIVVDENALTSDPAIVAAGDCSRHPNSLLGRMIRLESVHNALEQARTAAATLLGKLRPYRQMPWFWSDQFDTKWQCVGLAGGTVHQVVGDPGDGEFSVFSFADDRLTAVDSVNRISEHMIARELLNRDQPITRDLLEACEYRLEELAG